MPRKRVQDDPTGVLGTLLKLEKGYTVCETCHRSMLEDDVDEDGNCPDCKKPREAQ